MLRELDIAPKCCVRSDPTKRTQHVSLCCCLSISPASHKTKIYDVALKFSVGQMDEERERHHRRRGSGSDAFRLQEKDRATDSMHAGNSRMSPSAMSDGHHHTLTPAGRHVVPDLILTIRGTWSQVKVCLRMLQIRMANE